MTIRRDPPPTSMLKAFEAVARLNGFSRAAAELGLSQSAVSQRVAALEARLSVRLLHRGPGRLALTRDGAAYLRTVERALALLSDAEDRLAEQQATVRLSVVPSFARCWLVPRLAALAERFDDIRIELHAADAIMAVEPGEYDLAMRLGGADDRSGERLTGTDVLLPVHAPDVGGDNPLATLPLLQDDCHRVAPAALQSWEAWSMAAGTALPTGRHIVFSDAGLMVDAARAGAGIALARRSLVADDLRAGRLVAHGATTLDSPGQTRLIQRRPGQRTRPARRVAQWLLDEAARSLERDRRRLNRPEA